MTWHIAAVLFRGGCIGFVLGMACGIHAQRGQDAQDR